MLIHQGRNRNNEDVSFQAQHLQRQHIDCGMDERDIYFWGNVLRNCEAKIQPLRHLIISTFQIIHRNQEEEDKDFTEEQVRDMALMKYNLLTGR